MTPFFFHTNFKYCSIVSMCIPSSFVDAKQTPCTSCVSTVPASPVHVVPSTTEPGNGTDKKEGERAASSGHVLQKLENAHEVEEDGKNSACPQPAEHEQQMVPRVPTPDSNIDDGAGSGSGSAFSQQMLHQLDALQEGIDFIDDYME